MNLCVGWSGPCDIHQQFHGCRFEDGHQAFHECDCGARTTNDRLRLKTPRINPEHGIKGYDSGCRCVICTRAHQMGLRRMRR